MSIVDIKSATDQLKSSDDLDLKSHSDLQDVIAQDILQALKGLQFGEVTITVRDGRIVTIERIVRRRQILSKRTQ